MKKTFAVAIACAASFASLAAEWIAGPISVKWHIVDGEMKVEKSIPSGIAVVSNLQMRGQ